MVCARIVGPVVETKSDFTGGISNTTVLNYSGAMFIVGGSGVTFALSAVQDLVLAGHRSRTKVIEIVWSITDPGLSSLYSFACFQATELPIQPPWNLLSLSFLPSCPKMVPPEFASRYSTHVLLPIHSKD